MSKKFSTSPTLHLTIAESSLHECVRYLFIVAVVLALWELARGGYPIVVVSWTPMLALLLWRSRRQRHIGVVIRWRRGEWTIESDGQLVPVDLRRAHCLPWLTFMAWQSASGKLGQAWLFNDSAPPCDLRRLRVRLRLERGV